MTEQTYCALTKGQCKWQVEMDANQHFYDALNQWWKVALRILALALAIGVAIWLVSSALVRYPAQAATHFRYATVTAQNSVLCPGDMLRYEQVNTIVIAPVVVKRIQTLWSHETHRTVPTDTDERNGIYTEPVSLTFVGSWIVPKALPPGRYELRVAAVSEGRQPATYVVPFVILFSCKPK